jgi:lysozyme
MKVDLDGLCEIAGHEGIVQSPYYDSVGVLTWGVGHTAKAGEPNPAQLWGTVAPLSYVFKVLSDDLARCELRVQRAFTRPISQAQFNAAVSFDLNTGGILRANWVKRWNAGHSAKACAEDMVANWKKPAEIIPRRQAEAKLFTTGEYSLNGRATIYPADSTGKVLWSKGKLVDVKELLKKLSVWQPVVAPSPVVIPAAPALAAPAPLEKPEMTNVTNTVLATVKSAWASKVNWTMAAGVVFNILTLFGFDIPEDVRGQILTFGNSALFVLGWFFRTFMTNSVVKSSLK